jgi:uncharacterized protein YceK
MAWKPATLLLAAVAALACGCGTICNLATGNPDNYGGVQRDLQFAQDVSVGGGIFKGDGAALSGTGGAVIAAGILVLYGADLSLSFCGDTVTLPLAMYLRQHHEADTGN